MSTKQIRVLHFSDIFCVWAYISQTRVDELLLEHAEQVLIEHHFVHVFGRGAAGQVERWRDKGGLEAYADHVLEVASRFDNLAIHPRVWRDNPPRSSLAPHLYLSAIAVAADDPGTLRRALVALRRAFWVELADVCATATLTGIAEEIGISPDLVAQKLANGEAHEALGRDIELVRKYDIRTSPTFIFDDGRQRLVGNVGYRVIDANVRELVDNRECGHSCC